MSVSKDVTPLPTPIKGKADWREFRSFRLDNGVSCTVINDKEAKMVAAAATVDVGAAADPRSLSGLAHFTEHMLFLGNEKYPGENTYKSFLASHGGRSNASTSMHTTTFKFDIIAAHAEHALDIFSNFFVCPLFSESGVGREVKAVDSENSKNLTNDARRRLQILKALCSEEHYYSKFSTGNDQTLLTSDEDKLDFVRSALIAFHSRHYVPSNLTVVIAGPQSLDELQNWIVPRFSAMTGKPFPASGTEMTGVEALVDEAAKHAPDYSFDTPQPLYKPAFMPIVHGSCWPFLLTTKPLRPLRKLVLMFQLPSVHKDADKSPLSLISHLLGHEGPGSPFAVLQNHGLITALTSGPRVSAPDFTLFQIDIKLTKEGEERWKDVACIIFAHCRVIHEAAVQAQSGDSTSLRYLYEEQAMLGRIFFDQSSPGTPYNSVPRIVGSIVVNGTAKCLSAGSMLDESSDTLPVQEVLDFTSQLVPTNCFLERCSEDSWNEAEQAVENQVSGWRKLAEKWYGVDFVMSDIDLVDVKRFDGVTTSSGIDHHELHLPKPNRYIPRSLKLLPGVPTKPNIDLPISPPKVLVHNNEIGRLWWRLDDRYALPKASLTLLLRSPAVENSLNEDSQWQFDVNSSVHSSLLSGMFSEFMAQETYDASLAGLNWSLNMTPSGVQIACSGFSDRLSDLAIFVLQEYVDGGFVREPLLSSQKDQVLRNLRTYFESRRCDTLAHYYKDLLLASNACGIEDSLRMAELITLKSAKEQHQCLVQSSIAPIECLFTGNVSESEARNFFETASMLLEESRNSPTSPSNLGWLPGPLERRLPQGNDIELHFSSKNKQEENGAALVTYQSCIPGYKGVGMSPHESLMSSAAIRLLCHILREPLFDELRTKQTLGYIVSSYYDVSFTGRTQSASALGPLTTPVDSIVVTVISRKVEPPELVRRIDTFMDEFRQTLVDMPESQLRDSSTALKTQLLKPFQSLGVEASNHMGKIRRYGPEILSGGGSHLDLPWDSHHVLAETIGKLTRGDLILAWDRMVQPKTRSRAVSLIYGTTHPLGEVSQRASPNVVVANVDKVLNIRQRLEPFDNPSRRSTRLLRRFAENKVAAGVAAVAVLGVGYVGLTMLLVQRNKKGPVSK